MDRQPPVYCATQIRLHIARLRKLAVGPGVDNPHLEYISWYVQSSSNLATVGWPEHSTLKHTPRKGQTRSRHSLDLQTLHHHQTRRTQIMSSAPGSSHASKDLTKAAELVTPQTTRRHSRTTGAASQQNVLDPSQNASASSSRSTKRTGKMQRSSSQLDQAMSRGVNYTRTGRISKAKKGVKDAHVCTCGKVSNP